MPTNSSVVILKGRLGMHPETTINNGGNQITYFNLAIADDYNNGQEWVQQTVWMRCEGWGNMSQALAQKLCCGDYIEVRGILKGWVDQNETPRHKIWVQNFEVLRKFVPTSQSNQSLQEGSQDVPF